MRERVGHYRITGTLGEGGMGIVYAARDERLGRPVAIKMLRRGVTDPAAAERLRREARAAAQLTHPHVCQTFEIGGEGDELYVAMELLEGESLATRLLRGPLPPGEAGTVALATLSALEALHALGLVHRDLKPSNVFLTPHGVKLLDFGLAQSFEPDGADTRLTLPGTLLGTPQYLAPERILGQPADARADLFAVGAVLYEMLTGRPPFANGTMHGVVHAILHEHPPALGGSPTVAAVDRVIHRALRKRPQDRYATAAAMAAELKAALAVADSGTVQRPVRAMTRLIVLPFRVLRPDPEIDFLGFSLSDALTVSLSGLESLVVRSSLTAARLGAAAMDLDTIATQADVDAVLTGTLLRAEAQVRVTAQLASVPDGAVLWSQTLQAPLGDTFQLQDALTSRIVESLAVPLSARDERALRRDVPASAKAYEFYLRANQIAYQANNWSVARDLYQQALAEDPHYAPAWARLARLHRVLAMYGGEAPGEGYALAETAFQRALELNPDLSIAHNLYTLIEVETGRARDAMLRLLGRARAHTADAELFAGLVQACRYAGLERQAIAADEHARRIEPQIRTAVSHAYLAVGDYARAMERDVEDPPMSLLLALDLLGRRDEAVAQLRRLQTGTMPPLYRLFIDATLAIVEGRHEDARAVASEILRRWRLRDPCAFFYLARSLARAGHPDALPTLRRAVEGGYCAYRFYERDPWLDSLRGQPEFDELVRLARLRSQEAASAYLAAGGEQLLGPVEVARSDTAGQNPAARGQA